MPVRIVTDSSSDLELETARALDIEVVPFYIHFGEETYRDRVDLPAGEFYRRLAEGPTYLRTSQPAPADFVAVYRRLASPEGVLSIHVASRLSGIYNAAVLARRIVREEMQGETALGPIEVVDSQQAAVGLGLLVLQAARMAQAGTLLEALLGWVQGAVPRTETYATLPTLEYAYRSGRLDWARATLGNLLHIHPVVAIRQGEVHLVDRPRSGARALDRLVETVAAQVPLEAVAVSHSAAPQDAEALAIRIREATGLQEVPIFAMGPVIGGYAGPGALALGILRKESPA